MCISSQNNTLKFWLKFVKVQIVSFSKGRLDWDYTAINIIKLLTGLLNIQLVSPLSDGGSLYSSATALALSPTHLALAEPTHRGLHRFLPRHQDEIEIEIGDPVYVVKEAEDLWCEGK